MIKKTAYFCDICGKAFDDEESCSSHEIDERRRQFRQRVAFFDKNGDCVNNIKKASVFYVADKDAFDYVNKLLFEAGHINIPLTFKETVPNIFYTDTDYYCWRCLSNELDRLLELERKVKKVLDIRYRV